VPRDAVFNVEHEREDGEEEIEFQLKWSRAGDETPDEDESNDV